ncbi:DUF2635 domain-containing protein [Yersinia ruckeri]|uniref:DUF2635 domain-containing protein n=1 Tax=Yersinia ruckeri TaxID=29486 RepID=UPI0014804F01|nr:DUF2635 domain-containing protein [Yersinia ruckeri]MCK8550330.1 DUF2635 domain-containing protein [Yersinia ruckeri]MCK8572586.1 DUF2635 domain-containing protein [Yersinia ruckeri]MCK8578976.1 DUF2635 domain-containing protein [Yersinia ruckeri]MCK8582575.1 DUF2635 domain-containing protein [Yersinia ruckeri]MCW6518955.1 DUF2635 domain-containing protein [Yersinia ruckeri]
MTILKVKAVGGVRVPYQHNARKYIERETVDVPNTAYYLRQIAAGDLIIVAESQAPSATEDAPVTETAVDAVEPKAKTKAEASRGQS